MINCNKCNNKVPKPKIIEFIKTRECKCKNCGAVYGESRETEMIFFITTILGWALISTLIDFSKFTNILNRYLLILLLVSFHVIFMLFLNWIYIKFELKEET